MHVVAHCSLHRAEAFYSKGLYEKAEAYYLHALAGAEQGVWTRSLKGGDGSEQPGSDLQVSRFVFLERHEKLSKSALTNGRGTKHKKGQ